MNRRATGGMSGRRRPIGRPAGRPTPTASPSTANPSNSGPVSPNHEIVPQTRALSLDGSELLDEMPRQLVDALQYLVARYQLNDDESLPSPLAVVSALHGEGVTTISRSLGAIIAHDLDVTVCWVDLSWASGKTRTTKGKPAKGRAAKHKAAREEAPPGPGLFEVAAHRASLGDALEPTGDPRFKLLHAGSLQAVQGDVLIRSAHLADVIDELTRQFDFVIIDAPPVLSGSAGLIALRYASAYVMVSRHGVTTTDQMRSASAELRAIPSIGVVMNQYRSKIPKRIRHFFP
jgi:Mrp family chromosome partitioning ATPase